MKLKHYLTIISIYLIFILSIALSNIYILALSEILFICYFIAKTLKNIKISLNFK